MTLAKTTVSGQRRRTKPTSWLEGVIAFEGRQDNLAVREAAMIALGFNALMVVVAIVSIMLTLPKRKVNPGSRGIGSSSHPGGRPVV